MIRPIAPATQEENSTRATQRHFKVTEQDLPRFDFRARMIESQDELDELRVSWQRLADVSVRRNPFFDPEVLIPAVRHLGGSKVKVLVIDAPHRQWPDGPRVLCGLLPVIQRRIYGMPLSSLEIWKHDQCFDCTPLVRHDCAAQVLTHLFDYLGQHQKISLLSLNTVAGDGPFHQILTDVMRESWRTVFHRDAFSRACFHPEADADTYINTHVSKNTRKGTARLERRLRAEGDVRITKFAFGHSAEQWIDDFLALEASGWKGKNGTSLTSTGADQHFFRDIAGRALDSGKMTMLRIDFNDRPIAIMCDLHQGKYGVAFKTAYDESFSEFSPGLIAELANIRRLHDDKIEEMDSCADPDHSMINRVWSGRIRYQSLIIALGGTASRIAAASMPLIQLIGRTAKSNNRAGKKQVNTPSP